MLFWLLWGQGWRDACDTCHWRLVCEDRNRSEFGITEAVLQAGIYLRVRVIGGNLVGRIFEPAGESDSPNNESGGLTFSEVSSSEAGGEILLFANV